jgi:Mitochondrial carrier protein
MIAEACSCVLWVPIDVLKERLQVQSELKTYSYKNTFDAIGQISKKEGILGLYKAYGATILSFGPYTGISIALYDKIKRNRLNFLTPFSNFLDMLGLDGSDRPVTLFESFILSSASGFLASIVTNPMDIVKTRLQV